MSKVSRYVTKISGTNAYWHKVKEDLKAIVTTVGTPKIVFTFSSADMHWPELHNLLGSNSTPVERRQNVINNPHIADWFFTQRLEIFLKYWLYNTLDSGLCELTKVALKGVLADNLIKHHGNSTTPELEIGN